VLATEVEITVGETFSLTVPEKMTEIDGTDENEIIWTRACGGKSFVSVD
jgi:hypothetical protein